MRSLFSADSSWLNTARTELVASSVALLNRISPSIAVCQAMPVVLSSFTNSKYSMTSRCQRLEW